MNVTLIIPSTSNVSDVEETTQAFPLYVLILQITLVTLFCLVGIFGNAITIIAVLRFPYMRNSTNIFITNLALAGFLVCSLIMPLFLISLSYEGWPWGEVLCALVATVTITFFEVSLLTHLCIAVNRYVIVSKRRALTQKIFKLRNTVLICVGVWLFSVLLALPPLIGWGSYEFQENVHMCLAKQPESLSYSWFICILCAVIPAIVIVICYIRIYINVRASSRRLKNNESVARISYEVTGTSNCELELPREHESDSVFVTKEDDTNKNDYKRGDYFQKSVKMRTSSVSFSDEKHSNNSSVDYPSRKLPRDSGNFSAKTVTSTPEKSLSKIDIIITNPGGEEISRIWDDGETRFVIGNDDEIYESNDKDCKSVNGIDETELLPSDHNSSLHPIVGHSSSSNNVESLENGQEHIKSKGDKNRRVSCISNVSQLSCSKELKVAVNLFIIFVVFCLLWLPWLIMLLMSIFLIPPRPYSIITMLLFFLNPALNCLFYACRNSNFKKAFHQMFCCHSKQMS